MYSENHLSIWVMRFRTKLRSGVRKGKPLLWKILCPFVISRITKSCNLSHFFTYNCSYFSIEYVCAYSNSFTRRIGEYANYFCYIISSIGGKFPSEILIFYKYKIQQCFKSFVFAFTTIDPCIYKAGSIGYLYRERSGLWLFFYKQPDQDLPCC